MPGAGRRKRGIAMKCPQCGFQPREGAAFCPACGASLAPEAPKKKRSAAPVIAALALALGLALGALAWALLRPTQEPSLSAPETTGGQPILSTGEATAPPSTAPDTEPPAGTEPPATAPSGGTEPPVTAVATEAPPPATAVAQPEPTEEAPGAASGTGLSLQEQYKLNLFLSNFSEQWFGDCDCAAAPLDQLLRFAYLHTKINQNSEIQHVSDGTGDYYTISLDLARSKLLRFFNRTLEEPGEGTVYPLDSNRSFFYSGGSFYFPAADGESYSCLSVADSLRSLGDGTYAVTFRIYSVDEFSMGGAMVEDKSYYYLNAQGAATQAGLTYCGSGTAVVRPYNKDGIDSYQLISYQLD